jgi:hypothetical protein
MAFTAVQITFLQRLAAERPPSVRAGEIAQFFQANYSLGTIFRSKVEYRAEHFEAAAQLLRAHDLPVAALGPAASRADVAVFGGLSEKVFSTAPHARSVAIKPIGPCKLLGRELFAPQGGYLILTPEQACSVSCDRLMLVENFETFRTLEAYAWVPRSPAVMAVFRGDTIYSPAEAAEVIANRTDPVWGCFDFDPAGLAMAAALGEDRLESLLLPPQAWLEASMDSPRGRDLFATQVGQYGQLLDRCAHPEVATAWRLMKRERSAVTQERMGTGTSERGARETARGIKSLPEPRRFPQTPPALRPRLASHRPRKRPPPSVPLRPGRLERPELALRILVGRGRGADPRPPSLFRCEFAPEQQRRRQWKPLRQPTH